MWPHLRRCCSSAKGGHHGLRTNCKGRYAWRMRWNKPNQARRLPVQARASFAQRWPLTIQPLGEWSPMSGCGATSPPLRGPGGRGVASSLTASQSPMCNTITACAELGNASWLLPVPPATPPPPAMLASAWPLLCGLVPCRTVLRVSTGLRMRPARVGSSTLPTNAAVRQRCGGGAVVARRRARAVWRRWGAQSLRLPPAHGTRQDSAPLSARRGSPIRAPSGHGSHPCRLPLPVGRP